MTTLEKTIFEIDYKCGHTGEKDLSDKKPNSREDFAKWLSKNQVCAECFVKAKQRENKKEWQKEKQLEKEAAKEDQKRSNLPVLEGSDKQCDWALTVRYSLLKTVYEDLVIEESVMTEDEYEKEILEPARKITKAGWWIDNKDTLPHDLAQELSTAEDEGTDNENPF